MTLIDCPECGREVSTKAPACPSCGAPVEGSSPPSYQMFASLQPNVSEERPEPRRTPVLGMAATVLGLASLFLPFFVAVLFVPVSLICAAVASRREPKAWATVGVLFGLLGLAGAVYTSQKIGEAGTQLQEAQRQFETQQRERAAAVKQLTLESYDWKSSDYSTYLVGTVKNNSSRKFSLVHIQFSLLDRNEALVGTASDMTSSLQPGETWKFKANVFRTEGVRKARLAELTGTPE